MRKGNDLTTFIVPKVEKIRSLNLLDIPKGLLRPVAGNLYLTFRLGLFLIVILLFIENIKRPSWCVCVCVRACVRVCVPRCNC
jgi:hypothetical protein